MNVLFFGDSHTLRYISKAANKIQNEIKFDCRCVAGATAQGAVNPNSKTKALAIFCQTLERKKSNDYDYFGIMLGEVDCGFVMWYRAKKYNKTIQEQIMLAVNNLEEFLKKDVEKSFPKNKIVIFGATLPTINDNTDKKFLNGARSEIDASLRERIDCTFEYNNQLQIMAKNNNYLYFDISDETFDQKNHCAFPQFLNKNHYDHHFDEHSVAPFFVDKFKEL
tara:strand:- start:212 stop:877 length:666 start_codon:yes stop_codon:yes gene_type:complete